MIELYKNNLVHRDIKQGNILFLNGKYKIADFGFSKFMEDWQTAESMVGTPIFQSPEILNHSTYNYKSDIWALGILLFSLTFNSYPFVAMQTGH